MSKSLNESNLAISTNQLVAQESRREEGKKTYHNQCKLTVIIILLSFGAFYLGFLLTYYSNFSPETNENVAPTSRRCSGARQPRQSSRQSSLQPSPSAPCSDPCSLPAS